jgi:hypothetical protein
VVSRDRRRLAGSEREYLVIELIAGGLKIIVPCQSATAVGLRVVVLPRALAQISGVLEGDPDALEGTWSWRERQYREKLAVARSLARVSRSWLSSACSAPGACRRAGRAGAPRGCCVTRRSRDRRERARARAPAQAPAIAGGCRTESRARRSPTGDRGFLVEVAQRGACGRVEAVSGPRTLPWRLFQALTHSVWFMPRPPICTAWLAEARPCVSR